MNTGVERGSQLAEREGSWPGWQVGRPFCSNDVCPYFYLSTHLGLLDFVVVVWTLF